MSAGDHVTREWLARQADAVAQSIRDEDPDHRAGIPAQLRREERADDWDHFAQLIRTR